MWVDARVDEDDPSAGDAVVSNRLVTHPSDARDALGGKRDGDEGGGAGLEGRIVEGDAGVVRDAGVVGGLGAGEEVLDICDILTTGLGSASASGACACVCARVCVCVCV